MNAALQTLLQTRRGRKGALVLAAWLGFGLTFLITEEALPPLTAAVLLQLLWALGYFWAQTECLLATIGWFGRRLEGAVPPTRRYVPEALAVLAGNLLLTTVLVAGPVYYGLEIANWDGGTVPSPMARLLIRQLYLLPATFTLLVYGLLAAYFAVRQLQQIELEAERYRKESVQEQLETLKNQVNPELLFGSLHALSTLVYRDKDQAARFVDELSGVYRYVLDHKEAELVALAHELDFARSYLFLLSVRHPGGLSWQLPEPAPATDLLVPPLTLQFVLDACLEGLSPSPVQPLTLRIARQGGSLLLTCRGAVPDGRHQPLQTRLQGVVSRYRYLTDRSVSVQVGAGGLSVRIPLLEMAPEKARSR
ncbi:MAG: histidine kinase [Cytophagales bacterium]|nr:histidine kinase [Cytophagales bacterium]